MIQWRNAEQDVVNGVFRSVVLTIKQRADVVTLMQCKMEESETHAIMYATIIYAVGKV